MFELKRGDRNFLSGSCVAYSLLEKNARNNCANGMIGAFDCIFHDIEEFKKKMNPPKLQLEAMLEQIKKIREENPCFKSGVQVYSMSGIVSSEEKLLDNGMDAICMGDSHFIDNCRTLSQYGVSIYSLKYLEQLKFRNDYTKYKGKPIKDHFIRNFIQPLLVAYAARDSEQMGLIYTKMDGFVAGSHFKSDIDLIKRVFHHRKSIIHDLPLIELIVDKINAVHLEDYESAAKFNHRVSLILQRE